MGRTTCGDDSMTVPAGIIRKLATFQPLTQEEDDQWRDEIDYEKVHLKTKSIMDQAAYRATYTVRGHRESGFWIAPSAAASEFAVTPDGEDDGQLMTAPREILERLARFQPLTSSEEAQWADKIDYKEVHRLTGNVLRQAAYHATYRVAGHGGPGFYIGDEPEDWQHKDAVGWLWDQFGLPRAQKLKDDPGFLRADYLQALHKAKEDKNEAIRMCMKEYRVPSFNTMVQRLFRAGIRNLPWY